MPTALSGQPDAQRQLASLTVAVLLLGPGQRVMGANPAAEQFLGQSFRRIHGRALHEMIRFDEPRLAARLDDTDTPLSARDAGALLLGQGPRRLDVTMAPVAGCHPAGRQRGRGAGRRPGPGRGFRPARAGNPRA
jgi:two-component system nitrogen regulation sensor histidine kinase GlnL